MRAYASGIDLAAVRGLASVRDHGLTSAMRALSAAGSGYVVFPLAALSAGMLFWLGRRAMAALIVVSTCGAAIIENIDKVLVGRPRPPIRHLEHVASASFPSGHATQSTAFYGSLLLVALMLLPTRGKPPLIACAALVVATALLVCAICSSRIYLGVHYPTDVAGGLLLGAVWTAVVWREVSRKAAEQAASRPSTRR